MNAARHATRSLFGLPGTFFVFLSTIAVSNLGDAFRVMSLNLWFYEGTTDKELTRVLLLLAGVIPGMLFAPIAGAIADRFDLRKTFIATMLIRGALSVALAAVAWLIAPGALAYVLVFSAATASVFFASSAFVFVPRLIRRDMIPRANSIIQAVSWALASIGPALAALAFAAFGPSVAFLLDAASFLISAMLLKMLIRPEPADEVKTPISTSIRNGLSEAVDSVRGIPEAVSVLMRNRLALGMMIASYGVTFTAGVNSFGLIFLLDDELGLPAETLGIVLSWNGLIAVVAALIVGIFVKWVRVKPLFLACLAFFVVAQFVMGTAPNIVVLLIGVGISALVNAPYNVAVTSLFQTSVEDEHLGRIGGLDEMAENIIQIVVFLSAGIIVAMAGPRLALVGAGVVALILLCLGAILMRGLQPQGESEDAESANAESEDAATEVTAANDTSITAEEQYRPSS